MDSDYFVSASVPDPEVIWSPEEYFLDNRHKGRRRTTTVDNKESPNVVSVVTCLENVPDYDNDDDDDDDGGNESGRRERGRRATSFPFENRDWDWVDLEAGARKPYQLPRVKTNFG